MATREGLHKGNRVMHSQIREMGRVTSIVYTAQLRDPYGDRDQRNG